MRFEVLAVVVCFAIMVGSSSPAHLRDALAEWRSEISRRDSIASMTRDFPRGMAPDDRTREVALATSAPLPEELRIR
jgi:hypothetical protein